MKYFSYHGSSVVIASLHCVSKTHQLWNDIAQNYKRIDFDDILALAEIFERLE